MITFLSRKVMPARRGHLEVFMEKYRDILMYTISAITKTYLVYAAALACILIFSLIVKSKKVRNAMLVLLLCVLTTYSILVIPRYLDLRDDSFVEVENASIMIDDFYTYSTDNMFFGHANIFQPDGKTIEVSGTDFFEFPPTDELEEFYGDIVYAKRSHQLIAMENY